MKAKVLPASNGAGRVTSAVLILIGGQCTVGCLKMDDAIEAGSKKSGNAGSRWPRKKTYERTWGGRCP